MMDGYESEGAPERKVLVMHRSPGAVRDAIGAECAQIGRDLVAQLDNVLMGGEDLKHELTVTLPGGVKVLLSVSLELIEVE